MYYLCVVYVLYKRNRAVVVYLKLSYSVSKSDSNVNAKPMNTRCEFMLLMGCLSLKCCKVMTYEIVCVKTLPGIVSKMNCTIGMDFWNSMHSFFKEHLLNFSQI